MKLHLRIHGRVQGVWYRAGMQQRALELGLRGWVRNQPDGCVESVVQGPSEALDQLLDWCAQGPPAARVTRVDTEYGVEEALAEGFRILS
mgnify:CR=1 FL=1